MSFKDMSQTFKYNPDTGEETTRAKRYGNTRKKKAMEAVKERRKRRKELGGGYDDLFPGAKYDMD